MTTRLLGAVMLAVLVGQAASADTVRWTNSAGGAFEDNGNWDRGSPPGETDVAVFDLDAVYAVTVNASRVINGATFSRGDVTMNLTGFSLQVGVPGSSGSVFSVAPGIGATSSIARLVGGSVPYGTHASIGNGGQLLVTGTTMSDTTCIGCSGRWVTMVNGAVLSVDGGGIVNAQTNSFTGGTVTVSGGSTLRSDSFNGTGAFTVTGANSLLGAESGLTLGGTVKVLNGGSIRNVKNNGVIQMNAAVLVDGVGSSVNSTNNASMQGTGAITVQNGGLYRNHGSGPIFVHSGGTFYNSQSTSAAITVDQGGTLRSDFAGFTGAVNIASGGTLLGSGTFQGTLAVNADSIITSSGGQVWELPHGLTVNVDGLTTRSTPLIYPTVSSCMIRFMNLNGALTVNVIKNPNALALGRSIPILQHGTCNMPDVGQFTSFVGTPLDGGRQLVMSQTGSTGLVSVDVVAGGSQPCWSADFNGDGDIGTDADIEAFFACLGGSCCVTCGASDFNGDGDSGTDADIEAFFRVLGGGPC